MLARLVPASLTRDNEKDSTNLHTVLPKEIVCFCFPSLLRHSAGAVNRDLGEGGNESLTCEFREGTLEGLDKIQESEPQIFDSTSGKDWKTKVL